MFLKIRSSDLNLDEFLLITDLGCSSNYKIEIYFGLK